MATSTANINDNNGKTNGEGKPVYRPRQPLRNHRDCLCSGRLELQAGGLILFVFQAERIRIWHPRG
jgi:hypothetical protein